VLIPKGTAVAFSVYTMHRRPDLYGMDAELFRPERWDEDMPLGNNDTTAKWGYLPFNGGPRICLGSKCCLPLFGLGELLNANLCFLFTVDFALTEAAYTVVRILQRFQTIQLPDGVAAELTGVEKQTMTLVVSITEGCKAELR
jgi:Cytochrome P450